MKPNKEFVLRSNVGTDIPIDDFPVKIQAATFTSALDAYRFFTQHLDDDDFEDVEMQAEETVFSGDDLFDQMEAAMNYQPEPEPVPEPESEHEPEPEPEREPPID